METKEQMTSNLIEECKNFVKNPGKKLVKIIIFNLFFLLKSICNFRINFL